VVNDTKELNRGAVLTELLRHRPISRRDIASATGISPATVTRVVEQLIADGVVREERELRVGTRGRRAVLLDVVAERGHIVGVDLGASNTRLIVANLAGHPLRVAQLPTRRETDSLGLADWLADRIQDGAGPLWPTVDRVCIGVPGAVRVADSGISNAPNLGQVEDPRFISRLVERLGKPWLIDNDANYALLGELHFGAASQASTAAMLTIGTGLGAGLAIDRQVLRGEHGLVGEFGQLPVGPLGAHLEHMVTGPGILRRASEAGVAMADPAELFVPQPEPAIAQLRAQFDQAILIVLVAAAVSCEPQCIVVGGQVGRALAADADRYQEALQATLRVAPRISTAALGDFAGAAGAVADGLQRAYRELGVSDDHLGDLPAAGALTLATIERAAASQG
jgi:glucokinase